jgi:hypothetical protein
MTDHNYSIDALVEKIDSSKTREYFNEVMQTFYTSAYRSCIVTLYSVVICDIIFKLQELSDVYNDATATKILTEISDEQQKNPHSPDWEKNILDKIKERTSLLELYEVDAIIQLRNQRHLSAHPVLSESSILYTPNRETITAHIKNMLLFVLTKPAFFSKTLAINIINDIADNRDRLLTSKNLERYLEAKYFRNAKQELLNNLFKILWKFIFKLNDDSCKANRGINLLTLKIVYKKNRGEIEHFIRNEQSYFYFSNTTEIVCKFIFLLFEFPSIYKCLSPACKTLIDIEIGKNQEFKFISWFKYENFAAYFTVASLMFSGEFCPSIPYSSRFLYISEQHGKKKESLDLAITMFGESASFNDADKKFSYLIKPFINDFDYKQLVSIVSKIEGNGEISDRRAASNDNMIIRDALLTKNDGFDFTQYPNFNRVL